MAAGCSPSGVITRRPRRTKVAVVGDFLKSSKMVSIACLRREQVKEFSEEVLRDAAPIVGCRTNVVDWSNFRRQCLLSSAQQRRRWRFTFHDFLSLGGAKHRRRYASQRDPHVAYTVGIDTCSSRKADFRDRLCATRTDFSIVLPPMMGLARPWYTDASDQFIRAECDLFVAGPEVAIRKPART